MNSLACKISVIIPLHNGEQFIRLALASVGDQKDMLISPSASIINKRALDAVGGFDKDLSIYWEDDLFVRLFSAGYQNIYLEQPLSQSPIYQRGDTSSETAAKSRMIYACKLIPSRLRQCLPAVPVVEVASF